jgi:hypothetical protein
MQIWVEVQIGNTRERMGRNDDGKRQELLRAVDFIYSHTQVERSVVRAPNTRTKSEILTCIEDDRLYYFAGEVSDHGLYLTVHLMASQQL